MAYVTTSDYSSLYVGSISIPSDDFDALAERASDIIDELTQYRVVPSALSAFDLKQVKKAVCAQIEHLYLQGIETAVSGGGGTYRIGSASVTGQPAPRVSPMAIRLLAPTGLLYRGVRPCSV